MPRRRSRNKANRQGERGGAVAGPSSAQNLAASGTPTIAATTSNNNRSSNCSNTADTVATTTTAIPANNPPHKSVPLTAASGDREDSGRQHQVRVATPACLEPPQELKQSSHRVGAIALEQDRMNEIRKIYTSGADQVLAKPAPKLNVIVHVSLPAPMRGFKDVDPSDVDVKAVFSRIAKEHEAKIETEEIGSAVTITVMATNRAKAQKVIEALRTHLLYQPGEENVWRARLLVHPPRYGKDGFAATLQSKEGATGRRVIAVATEVLKPIDQAGLVDTKTAYKGALMTTLDQTTSILRNNPSGMRMRVHFGTLVLGEWKKDKAEYNYAELESLVRRAGPRGTAHMQYSVSETAAKALIDQLSPSNEELPGTVREFLGGGPECTYSLILDTKNLNVESTFEKVQGQMSRGGNGRQVQQYTLGPLTAHQVEKQQRAAEVITVCPESAYDWAIEIRKTPVDQDTRASAPFNVQQLEKNIKFTGGRHGDGFPNITIFNHFLQKNDIEKVHGKTSLRYMLGSRYNLEINLFHEWKQNKLGNTALEGPVTVAAVTLEGDGWDIDMSSGVPIPRDWENDFSEQFLLQCDSDEAPETGPGKPTEPMDHFLLWVDWILKALEGASEKSSEAAG